MQKKVSVVIASGAGSDFIFHCLDSLREQVSNPEVEVIVVDRCGNDTVERIEKNYPFVNLVNAPQEHRPGVPELRMIGVLESQGDIIAVIEEHCIASSDWIKTISSSFKETDAAIGGPILDDDYQRLPDWVVYFSEYHNYLPPWTDGERYLLNGVNIAYNRQMVMQHEDVLKSGYWEVVLHPLLAQDGDFRSIPEMKVRHSGPFDYGYYLNQRYLLSRVWGGTQRDKISQGKRMLYLILGPIIPILLLGRITLKVLQSGHLLGKFIASIPLLIPVTIAYAWGEWLGYLVGIGDALERVE